MTSRHRSIPALFGRPI